jgi:hypothetical protein
MATGRMARGGLGRPNRWLPDRSVEAGPDAGVAPRDTERAAMAD